MKGSRRARGYTIIEIMIVLAISGLMFVIAAVFISGKEAKTAFSEGSNQFAAQLQAVISQVMSGDYSDIGLTCTSSGGTTSVGVGSNPQGSNSNCVFLGKVVFLAEDHYNSSSYQTLSLAGARTVNVLPGHTITPDDLNPAVIDPLTTHATIPEQLDVTKVTETLPGGGTKTSVGLAFLPTNIGSTDAQTGNLNSGAQSISLYYVDGLTPGGNPSSLIGTPSGHLNPADSATICLTDHTRYAELTLGGTTNASSLSVNVQVVPTC